MKGLAALCGGLLGALAATAVPCAQAAEPLELKVKAAFVFNFVRFASWPPERLPDPASVIDLCVLGDPGFLDAVRETVSGKSVGAHPLRARALSDPAELASCHLAYVGQAADAARALSVAAGHGVLTVHDGATTSPHGVVRFFLEERRIRFEINSAAAARENLQLSSKLLSLASMVSM